MEQYLKDFLKDKSLIVVSNHGPVKFIEKEGTFSPKKREGGLATALLSLTRNAECTWIAAATSANDRRVAKQNEGKPIGLKDRGLACNIRLVRPSKKAYDKYYNVIANPLLWFIQHYLWNPAYTPLVDERIGDAWYKGYVKVNQLFAEAILDTVANIDKRPLVMFQDYYFYLAPRLVRARNSNAFLYHFIHIPWPQPDYWKMLPTYLRRPIMEGILANDIVAFQTQRNVFNFLRTCEDILNLPVDYEERTVDYKDRKVQVKAHPISINTEEFSRVQESPKVKKEERKLAKSIPKYLVLRVDRADLSKNIVRGFIAIDIFLRDHPEFIKDTLFLTLLNKTRQDVQEYVEYMQRIFEIADEVNRKHATDHWRPIEIIVKDDFPQIVAAYKQYDVLLVNPIYDGMNLVSKEGPLVNQRNGVLILSENAGAYEQLGHFALSVSPFDVEWTANTIYRALTMTEEEKRWRQNKLKQSILENDIFKWIGDQFRDMEKMISP
jgi:trehalose 6-phosphate synthase